LLQFRRRATQLGQLEDWFIFNGTYPSIDGFDNASAAFAQEKKVGLPGYRPDLPYLKALAPGQWALMSGTPTPIAGVTQDLQLDGMRQRNPGSLGLIEAPRVVLAKEAKQARREAGQAKQVAQKQVPRDQQDTQQAEEAEQRAKEAEQRAQQASDKTPLDNDGLMHAIVKAINSLEENGYVAPYVCVFGRNPFKAAFTPINNSTVLPRDRIEPLIGRELLHSSGIDILPHRSDLYNPKVDKEEWQSRGVLLSMANEPIDLALAAEATVEFRQVDLDGRYVFSVFERFALRIKDAKAIVPLMFEEPASGGTATSTAPPAAGAGEAPAARRLWRIFLRNS
jgi:hypothetical protein